MVKLAVVMDIARWETTLEMDTQLWKPSVELIK